MKRFFSFPLRRLFHRAAHAPMALLTGSLLTVLVSGSVSAQTFPQGLFRPENDFDSRPNVDSSICMRAATNQAQRDVCGYLTTTYEAPHYIYAYVTTENTLRLISDKILDVVLSPDPKNKNPESKNRFSFPYAGGQGILTMEDDCPSRATSCFTVSRVPDDFELSPNVLYVNQMRDFGVEHSAPLDDLFANYPANFAKAKRCYNIGTMETGINLYKDTSCRKEALFSEDEKSKRYQFAQAEQKLVVPWGWHYVSEGATGRKNRSQVIETEREMIDTEMRTIGWNTGANLGIVNFSVQNNQKTSLRIDRLYNERRTETLSQWWQTEFALVLDKWRAQLNKNFVDSVARIVRNSNIGDAEYAKFVEEWGTHYSFASTFGSRGYQRHSVKENKLQSVIEQGLTDSMGLKGGADAGEALKEAGFGSANVSTGWDQSSSSEKANKMRATLEEGFEEYLCVGSACEATNPPELVFTDLRAISDLISPPFMLFSGLPASSVLKGLTPDQLLAFRDGLRAYIHKTAFRSIANTGLRTAPPAMYWRLSGFDVNPFACRVKPSFGTDFVPLSDASLGCGFEIVKVVAGNGWGDFDLDLSTAAGKIKRELIIPAFAPNQYFERLTGPPQIIMEATFQTDGLMVRSDCNITTGEAAKFDMSASTSARLAMPEHSTAPSLTEPPQTPTVYPFPAAKDETGSSYKSKVTSIPMQMNLTLRSRNGKLSRSCAFENTIDIKLELLSASDLMIE